jgi:hypothetical protein
LRAGPKGPALFLGRRHCERSEAISSFPLCSSPASTQEPFSPVRPPGLITQGEGAFDSMGPSGFRDRSPGGEACFPGHGPEAGTLSGSDGCLEEGLGEPLHQLGPRSTGQGSASQYSCQTWKALFLLLPRINFGRSGQPSFSHLSDPGVAFPCRSGRKVVPECSVNGRTYGVVTEL